MSHDGVDGPLAAVILAGGFVTNVPAHARTVPVALRPIAGRLLIDLLAEKLSEVVGLEIILLLTNETNRRMFEGWREAAIADRRMRITLVSNGITGAHKSRGAARDLAACVEKHGLGDRPVLVVGADNFFEDSLREFAASFRRGSESLIAVHEMPATQWRPGAFGVVTLRGGRVETFTEKAEILPANALVSTLCCIFPPSALQALQSFAESADGTWRPGIGAFLQHLVESGIPVDGVPFRKRWWDVGSPRDHRELNQRELAMRFNGEEKFQHPIEAVIMFADIIGSVFMAEFLDLEDYDAFLAEYQLVANEAIKNNLKRYHCDGPDLDFVEYSIRGDEALLILYTRDPERDAKMALSTAMDLKRGWLLSRFNRSRKGRAFYDVGIGIHYGSVMLGRHMSTVNTTRTFNAEGYAISLAKRIENFSREGRLSRIMLSKSFVALAQLDQVHTIKVSDARAAKLAGIYGAAAVHELEVHGDIEDPQKVPGAEAEHLEYCKAVLENSQHDLWLLLMIARYYYDHEDYTAAQRYYTDAIERFPEFAAGYMFLGRSLYRQHRFDDARAQLDAALARNRTSLRIKCFLAVTLRRLEDYDGALRLHEEAVQAPMPTAYDHNAYAYTLSEKVLKENPVEESEIIAKAEEHLALARRTTEAADESLDFILDHTAGMIHLARGQTDEAIGCFHRVIAAIESNDTILPLKRADKQSEARFHLGTTLCRENRWAEGIAELKHALAVAIPDGSRAPYWFAEARKIVKKWEEKTARTSGS